MPAYRLSGVAEQQIREALAWSEDRFGEVARSRYAALLVTAMTDVAKDPDQPNVAKVRIGGRDLGLYHIARSRQHVANPAGGVGEPRQLLVFELGAGGIVDILGLVHERMLRGRALRRLLRGVIES